MLLAASLTALALGLGAPAGAAAAPGRGAIEGVVTDAASGAAIGGVEVCAFPDQAVETLSAEELEAALTCVTSADDGGYAIQGLFAGEYEVSFAAPSVAGLDYIGQSWNGVVSGEPDPVTVTAGAVTAGIDARLSHGGEIGGEVTDQATGAPIAHALVCALEPGTEISLACAFTAEDGGYELTALSAGDVVVGFAADGHAVQYYDGAQSNTAARQLTVRPPALIESVDAALQASSAPKAPIVVPGEATTGALTPIVAAGTSPFALPEGELGLVGRHVTVARGGYALVRVSCPDGFRCRGSAELTVLRPERAAGRVELRTVTVGAVTGLSVPPGTAFLERVRLSALARSMLRAGRGSLHAEVVLISQGAARRSFGVKLLG